MALLAPYMTIRSVTAWWSNLIAPLRLCCEKELRSMVYNGTSTFPQFCGPTATHLTTLPVRSHPFCFLDGTVNLQVRLPLYIPTLGVLFTHRPWGATWRALPAVFNQWVQGVGQTALTHREHIAGTSNTSALKSRTRMWEAYKDVTCQIHAPFHFSTKLSASDIPAWGNLAICEYAATLVLSDGLGYNPWYISNSWRNL